MPRVARALLAFTLAGVFLESCKNDNATDPLITSAETVAFVVQPANSTVGVMLAPAVQVAFEDFRGNVVANITGDSITISIDRDPGGGTLSGTVTVAAVNCVATFSNLSVSRAGVGYTLDASTPSFPVAMSGAFNVVSASASKRP
jgi:hypothetical protein